MVYFTVLKFATQREDCYSPLYTMGEDLGLLKIDDLINLYKDKYMSFA